MMKAAESGQRITLGITMSPAELAHAARAEATFVLAEGCAEKMAASEHVLRRWACAGREIYGVTTGLGALKDRRIDQEMSRQMQKNILRSHAVSVGRPLSREQVRATMIMVVQNLSRGYSGVRKALLDKYIELLNGNVTPWAPGSGSVGYLCPEAHIGLNIIGEGRAYYNGELLGGAAALGKAGIAPLELEGREALAMISGTTSATAIGTLALCDLLNAADCADLIAALNVEVTAGQTAAFAAEIMQARPHPAQERTAERLRMILRDSQYLQSAQGRNLQDPLSIRCIPQLHGAARTLLENARDILETEINSCCDNPLIFADDDDGRIMSGCNADASFIGLAMDSACMAAGALAKMAERRTYRLLDGSVPGLPLFLIKNPGINSGLMITQYAQAGLLNEMRILAAPASTDNVPTSAGQEDYVAMGYNAARKAAMTAEKLEYILAIELLAVYQAGMSNSEREAFSSCAKKIFAAISQLGVPAIVEDEYLHDHIEKLKVMIHNGDLTKCIIPC